MDFPGHDNAQPPQERAQITLVFVTPRNWPGKTPSNYPRIEREAPPRDPITRHAWLFAKHWVEESAEEIEDDEHDYSQRAERVHQQRLAAMTEIWGDRGFEGAMALRQGSEAPGVMRIGSMSNVGPGSTPSRNPVRFSAGASSPWTAILNALQPQSNLKTVIIVLLHDGNDRGRTDVGLGLAVFGLTTRYAHSRQIAETEVWR